MVSDEEYARRLQEEYDREVGFSSTSLRDLEPIPAPMPIENGYPRIDNGDDETYRGINQLDPDINPSYDEDRDLDDSGVVAKSSAAIILDEEYAQRIDQQLRDEELARQMQGAEDAAVSRIQQQQRRQINGIALPADSSNQPRSTSRGCKRNIKSFLCLSFVLALVAICGVVVYSLLSGKNVPYVTTPIDNIADIFHDPWYQDGQGGKFPTSKWKNNGNGLKMTVYNALTSDWYTFFDNAVHNWAFGTSPTSLLLSTSVISADPTCSSIQGAIKVCNSDYGDTGWKGINEVLVTNNGYITESVAKMNEYYLSSASSGEKQYTMCHEMGHGFGLNHADENFNNPDLGTCMDYTNHPANNQKPNANDFNILYQLYGYIPNSRLRERGRRLASNWLDRLVGEEPPRFTSFTEGNRENWRLLKRTDRKEVHELDLGHGFRMIAHVLLV